MAAAAVASTSRPLRAGLGGASSHAPHHFTARPLQLQACRPRLAVAASAVAEEEAAGGPERFYFNFTGFPFPLGPFLNRRTIRTEAVKGSIWLFEQEQALGFSSVSTNIRMTVVKLKSGGLWVHAPIAPTKECIQARTLLPRPHTLLKELDAPVEHIVLPTFAYEHKIFVGPFSRKFPKAQIWVAPRQWSWPVNLPLEFFGIFRARSLKDEDEDTPWAAEIKQKVLSSPEVGISAARIGPYVEVAFYHKPSRTLLVTDAVIFVPRQPPACISKESLLASAENGLAVKLLSKGKEVPDEPVVDNKLTGRKVRDWVDRIAADWPFRRIIPCHFAAPINAGRSDFLAAFAFLDELLPERSAAAPGISLLFASLMGKAASYFPPDDMKTLSSLDEFLVSVGAVKKTVSGRKR
ncbi:hypothetical protein PR202_ga05635 [Eleusine coracana subsp. coracana]|uniref:Uncharacterized protein n=1 Tax=Eleusine coracana subsp. coracana TaxID=191504 RepID=A0AAV5BRJ7_ELECO|nr:hypothetical protein PR202_ga05181 [Eleusine coracana subsp. coracana]GJM89440.1 hypothetical protein PR202_ga05635 [Eleusine coracana subsp. coracana]